MVREFGQRRKVGKRSIRFQEVIMGNLSAVEEEGNTHGRKILAR